jgi:hypothetical protein
LAQCLASHRVAKAPLDICGYSGTYDSTFR